MTTRGIYGFRINETDKLAYNHADSYPEKLGATILQELGAVNDWEMIRNLASSLVPIHETRKLGLNDEIIRAELRRHYPTLEYGLEPKDFYELFSPLQGTLKPYLSGRLSFMATANEFIDDSLFCEWGCIANLDSHELEVYRGLQRIPPAPYSRYQGEMDRMGYYPAKMVQAYSLDKLPSNREFLGDLTAWRWSEAIITAAALNKSAIYQQTAGFCGQGELISSN